MQYQLVPLDTLKLLLSHFKDYFFLSDPSFPEIFGNLISTVSSPELDEISEKDLTQMLISQHEDQLLEVTNNNNGAIDALIEELGEAENIRETLEQEDIAVLIQKLKRNSNRSSVITREIGSSDPRRNMKKNKFYSQMKEMVANPNLVPVFGKAVEVQETIDPSHNELLDNIIIEDNLPKSNKRRVHNMTRELNSNGPYQGYLERRSPFWLINESVMSGLKSSDLIRADRKTEMNNTRAETLDYNPNSEVGKAISDFMARRKSLFGGVGMDWATLNQSVRNKDENRPDGYLEHLMKTVEVVKTLGFKSS